MAAVRVRSTLAIAAAAWAAASLRFAARKNGISGPVLTVTAAAGAIRTSENNRVDNQLACAAVANHCRRRSLCLRGRFSA
jgi:hypothetical protein